MYCDMLPTVTAVALDSLLRPWMMQDPILASFATNHHPSCVGCQLMWTEGGGIVKRDWNGITKETGNYSDKRARQALVLAGRSVLRKLRRLCVRELLACAEKGERDTPDANSVISVGKKRLWIRDDSIALYTLTLYLFEVFSVRNVANKTSRSSVEFYGTWRVMKRPILLGDSK